jgi:hypothetical protein
VVSTPELHIQPFRIRNPGERGKTNNMSLSENSAPINLVVHHDILLYSMAPSEVFHFSNQHKSTQIHFTGELRILDGQITLQHHRIANFLIFELPNPVPHHH